MPVFDELLFQVMLGSLIFGALLSFALQRKSRLSILVGFSFANIASLSGLLLGPILLLSKRSLEMALPWTILGTNLNLQFRIDSLSAFFITVFSVLSLSVSIFSYGYTSGYIGKKNLGVLGLFYNLFIFSMLALVSSGNIFMFLFFWEIMSMVSYFLVVFEHQDSRVRSAGFIYIVMTHIGTAFIIIAFLLLYKETGSYSFGQYSSLAKDLSPSIKNLIFILVTIGFGTKAGIIPLHIWLPKAHPAAPSNVSAIMSGVMLKTAIYGFIRIAFGILGVGPVWWGGLILVIGAVSALLGVMYALMEHDIKRLLAYHSVENIGIILMGIGAALILLGYGYNDLALIGLTAGLFHTLNHAVFKGLLFLGAGAVHHATHTRNIEEMGGLLKRMPWTGFFFLIGSISISAIPPFNGFASEWLTYQALLALGSAKLGVTMNIMGPVFAASLALTGALAAACFVKAFGTMFLALPRSSAAEKAKEAPKTMLVGMGLLVICCLIFGVIPFIAIDLLSPVTAGLIGVETTPLLGGYRWLNLTPIIGQKVDVAVASVSPLMVLAVLGFSVFLISIFVKKYGKYGEVHVDETWNCGVTQTSKMEYTATSFSKPIRIMFRAIFQPSRKIKKEYVLKPYFTSHIVYEGDIKPFFEDNLYRPLHKVFIMLADRITVLQSGSIQLYLGYIFVTLVVLLIFA
ncbi:formate hydrogenlyase subunit 3/multisubunit Na+/H+ antiporter, MnhD subunit [Desulfosporosinus orientis DSM 765]|uniref:Formate hydrogenlyase subunit 3/multisubunit Na+/H+ antiporter, MnhD subunit n=1 Tax=Desulfosporosinus orientis (strain ATCC 19365 / DSM 765 / NCIMB 8382 / VKM B-1628 / Singapore I) TaxID=768706 RepID=G7WEN6_DESOD|nr:hydrogenase 4 subunit B [Desulfosporosinus orientis]AET66927.1 formate hydrogenlyase subunit 3/multisubunit Na+/H+ antiporter, MnhD subunit [Desulfosporosinus orientis DSM 765]